MRRELHAEPRLVARDEFLSSSQSTTVWMPRTTTAKDQRGRRRRAGGASHRRPPPISCTTAEPARAPRRDDRHATHPNHCEYLGLLRVRRGRRAPSSISGEAQGAAAGKRAPVLRFPRIDRLGDRECRRRPRERGQDMYGKGRRRGGGGYLARTPASDLWIAGRTQPSEFPDERGYPHMCRAVNWVVGVYWAGPR
jgi:hypothetical protein